MTKTRVRVFGAVAAAQLEQDINDWIAAEQPVWVERASFSVAAGSTQSAPDTLYALVAYEPRVTSVTEPETVP